MISFFIPCIPSKVSHHQKRIYTMEVHGKTVARVADKPKLVATKKTLRLLLLPHARKDPITGPIRLVLDFTWPWRKSDSRRLRNMGRIPCDVAPDWDNVAKTLTDVLAEHKFFENDSRVADGRVRKWFGDEPGIKVEIWPIDNVGGTPLEERGW